MLVAVAFVAILMVFTPKLLPNWMVGRQALPLRDRRCERALLAPRAN